MFGDNKRPTPVAVKRRREIRARDIAKGEVRSACNPLDLGVQDFGTARYTGRINELGPVPSLMRSIPFF